MSSLSHRVIGTGRGTDGETWELTVDGGPAEITTMVRITRPDGKKSGGGMGGPALLPGRRLSLSVGNSDGFPREIVLRVAPDVRGVVVLLSDATWEDLVLFGDPEELGCRVAALVYPRHLDVHRIDLYDANGAELSDEF